MLRCKGGYTINYFYMKAPFLLPLLLLSACTIHIGPTTHEQPSAERIMQLIANIPEHGIDNANRDEFTPEYYQLLSHAWAIPSDAVGDIGSDEWLYYFVSGNGEPAAKTLLGDIRYQNDTVVADFNMLFPLDETTCDTVFHYLTLTHNGEKWVISDFDDTKFHLQQYIQSQRQLLQSSDWQDYLNYVAETYPNGAEDVAARRQQVEAYFQQYPKE